MTDPLSSTYFVHRKPHVCCDMHKLLSLLTKREYIAQFVTSVCIHLGEHEWSYFLWYRLVILDSSAIPHKCIKHEKFLCCGTVLE